MNTLLIDIGNSTVDIRLLDANGNIEKIIRPRTNDMIYQDAKMLFSVLSKYNIKKIIYTCVVEYYNQIITDLAKLFECPLKKITSKDINPKDLSIDDVNDVAGDFICNFLAMKEKKKTDFICVSLGTASTVFIAIKGIFSGAIICPGMEIAAKSLFNNANKINEFNWESSDLDFGKNTAQAVDIGVVNAHFKMVHSIVKDLQKKYNIKDVVFTGGNCNKIIKLLEQSKINFCEDLIFQGLSLFN